jgi:hypothetical protein
MLGNLFEVAGQHLDRLVDPGALLLIQRAEPGAASSFSSSSSSTDSPAKLLTKFSGFLISWAMPAVNWPKEDLVAWISQWTQ